MWVAPCSPSDRRSMAHSFLAGLSGQANVARSNRPLHHPLPTAPGESGAEGGAGPMPPQDRAGKLSTPSAGDHDAWSPVRLCTCQRAAARITGPSRHQGRNPGAYNGIWTLTVQGRGCRLMGVRQPLSYGLMAYLSKVSPLERVWLDQRHCLRSTWTNPVRASGRAPD